MDDRLDEKQEQKFHQMTETPVGRLICRLALPCIISMLVTSFYNMADTFFVGMLKSNSATGAVGVVFSLMAIIQAVGFFFGHGSGNFISRELGRQNFDEASKMAATGFFSALAAGALICALGLLFLEPLALLLGSTATILPYTKAYLQVILLGAPWMTASLVLNNQLRYQGSAAYAMVGIASGAVLNIGLDPVFIFALDLGVAGAAWATILSQAAACAFALCSLRLPGLPVPLRWGRFQPALCKKVLFLGTAPFLTYALDSVILIVLNAVLQRRGGPGEGDVLITCAAIVQSYMLLISMPMSGITLGCQGVVSFNLGAANRARVEQALRGVLLLCLGFAALMLAVTHLCAPWFVRLFTGDAQVMARSVSYIKLYTAGVLFMAVQWMAVDMSTALGQVGLALFCSLVRKILFLTGVLLFPALLTAAAAFAAEPFCDVTASIISAVLFLRFTPRLLARRCAHKQPCAAESGR